MRSSFVFAAATLAACAGAALPAIAADTLPARPLFARLPGLHPSFHSLASTGLPYFNVTYTYNGSTYTEQFVGNDPSTNSRVTVPVYIIPLDMVFGSTSYSPSATKLANGQTVVQNIETSPMFKSSVDYVQGGVDLGRTQYIDAFERGNLWSTVKTHTGSHMLLGTPTVMPEQTVTVSKADGKLATEFGVKNVILDYITSFDKTAQSLLVKLKIPSNALPIFVTTQTYLTQYPHLLCCIGGYHSVDAGGLPYSMFTYITTSGVFSQDVSALSHEIGEWVNDPNTNNNSPCGIYETGDPLENEANYGDYTYATKGFAYHLQDLAFLPYFGAPAATSVNGFSTFQGTPLTVCQNGA